MYIACMRLVFAILLCMPLAGFAEEAWESHKCYEFLKIVYLVGENNHPDYKFVADAIYGGEKKLKEPQSMREPGKEAGYCYCDETAVCENSKLKFCTSYKCEGEKIIYLEAYRLVNTGGGGSNSGSSGQP